MRTDKEYSCCEIIVEYLIKKGVPYFERGTIQALERNHWAEVADGAYLLRTNLQVFGAEEL